MNHQEVRINIGHSPCKRFCGSTTQAKVHIKDLTIRLWIHLVDESPSILSLRRLCNELGYSSKFLSVALIISSGLLRFPQHRVVPSQVSSDAEGNFRPEEKETEKTMLDLLKPFTDGSETSPSRTNATGHSKPSVESHADDDKSETECARHDG